MPELKLFKRYTVFQQQQQTGQAVFSTGKRNDDTLILLDIIPAKFAAILRIDLECVRFFNQYFSLILFSSIHGVSPNKWETHRSARRACLPTRERNYLSKLTSEGRHTSSNSCVSVQIRPLHRPGLMTYQIGRASCRER